MGFFFDDFNRADGAIGSDWVQGTNASSSWAISGNKAVPGGTATARSDWARAWNWKCPGPDYYVQGKITRTTTTNGTVELLARSYLSGTTATLDNWYAIQLLKGSGATDSVRLQKKVAGGSNTTLGASITGITWVDGDTLRLEVEDDRSTGNVTLRAYQNGVLLGTRTDTAHFGIPGRPGMRGTTTGQGAIDDFDCGYLTGISNLATPPLLTVSDTGARIQFRVSDDADPQSVTIEYSTASNMSGSTTTSAVNVGASTDWTGRIDITGLSAGTTYYYRLKIGGVAKHGPTFPSFTTAPANGTAGTVKIALGGCWDQSGRGAVYTQVASKSPNFMLFPTNANYQTGYIPDPAGSLANMRGNMRMAYTRGTPFDHTQRGPVLEGLPCYWMFGDRDSAYLAWYPTDVSNHLYYGDTIQAWYEYVGKVNPDPYNPANEPVISGTTNPPGVPYYYAFQWGKVGVFVLDEWSYRSADNAVDNSSKTRLGTTQKADLKAWLSDNNDEFPVKVIVSSVMIASYTTHHPGDGYGGTDPSDPITQTTEYSTERNELLDYIQTNKIRGVMWLSSHQLWSLMVRISRGGIGHYEFHCSPIGHATSEALTASNSSDILHKSQAANVFGMVTIDTSVSPPTVVWELFNSSGVLQHSESWDTSDTGQGLALNFGFTGPATGPVGSASGNFTVTPDGDYTGTVTPSDGGAGGTFTPASLSWTGDAAAKTFTYTAATPGAKTISLANSWGLPNPANLSYTAAAGGVGLIGPGLASGSPLVSCGGLIW